ncbi:MAG: hypothetical protein ACUVQ5_04670 [Candidatus Methanomethylicaceae archaeon]
MAWRTALSILLRPHPIALILTALLIFAIQEFSEYQQVLAMGTLYFTLLNMTFNLEKIRPRKPEVLPTPFLLALSKNLRRSSPELAFLLTFESMKTQSLCGVIRKMRNGIQLTEALRTIKCSDEGEALLPVLLSDLFSFSSEEASNRIATYVAYRKEKERIRAALAVKIAALSLRFKVLCLISSSSLAVIAFAAPFLYSIRNLNWVTIRSGSVLLFSLDPAIMIPCISTAIASTYAYSKLLPGLDGLKLSFFSALLFITTEILLVMVMGWSI